MHHYTKVPFYLLVLQTTIPFKCLGVCSRRSEFESPINEAQKFWEPYKQGRLTQASQYPDRLRGTWEQYAWVGSQFNTHGTAMPYPDNSLVLSCGQLSVRNS